MLVMVKVVSLSVLIWIKAAANDTVGSSKSAGLILKVHVPNPDGSKASLGDILESPPSTELLLPVVLLLTYT